MWKTERLDTFLVSILQVKLGIWKCYITSKLIITITLWITCLNFLKTIYFYFRYFMKIKLMGQGFSLFLMMVSHTFPQVMMDCEWEWNSPNDSSESGLMWDVPFVTPVCKHTLRMLTKYRNRPRPKSLLFQDDPKDSVSESTRTIWDSC